MTNSAPSVVLAAGTSTGAGTTVALVEACRTLARQLAAGEISSAEVRIPEGADEARSAATGCAVRELKRTEALLDELVDRTTADVYIGFADRLPINGRSGSTRIMVVQNPHLYVSSDAPSLGEIGRRVRAAWARRSTSSADLIICATNASRDAVLDAVPGLSKDKFDVRPIRPATPPPRTEWAQNIARFVLLGDLYSYKRFDVALDGITTWAQARSDGPDVVVVHCGLPRDDKGVADFAAAVGRAESAGVEVVQLGSVTHDQAMNELLKADVLVSASEVETQGLTVLEAMAVGVPVIARGIGPIEDVGGEAIATFAVDGGPTEVAKALSSIEDVAVRTERAKRGLERSNMTTGWNLLP